MEDLVDGSKKSKNANFRKQWTAEEIEKLNQAFKIHGPNWEKVSQAVGRTPMACKTCI